MKKWIIILVSSLVSLGFAACSSEDDVITDIDDNSLYSLFSEDTPIVYDLDEYADYSKTENGDWYENFIGGVGAPIECTIVVIGKQAWAPITDRGLLEEPRLMVLWNLYQQEAGYDKDCYRKYQFTLSADKKAMTIDGNNCVVEETTDSTLTVSLQRRNYENIKTVCKYKRRDISDSDMKKIIPYDTEQEAKIAMIQRIHKYYGDVLDLSQHSDFYTAVIDLARLEADIISGKDTSIEYYYIN